jgi:hypothetical protein
MLGGVLLAACSVTPVLDPAGPVPLVRGDAASFTPLVAESSVAPSCQQPSDAPLDPGSRALALVYPDPAARQVTVTVDRAGVPTRYLDVRGDLVESDSQVADRTTIALYLDRGYAVLSNREGAAQPDVLEVPLADVLTSPRLGNPDSAIQHVLATCG